MSDYDYDTLGNRYITSYLHTLKFRDVITETDLFEFSFPSDACADMILILLKLITTGCPVNGSSVIITPDSVNGIFSCVTFTSGSNGSLFMRVSNSRFSFINSPRFIFVNEKEISDFASLLEADDILDMYVEPSSDRW